jgi:hypothetical protein
MGVNYTNTVRYLLFTGGAFRLRTSDTARHLPTKIATGIRLDAACLTNLGIACPKRLIRSASIPFASFSTNSAEFYHKNS